MKVLIVQGINESNINPVQLKQLWYPCMATVKSWAKRNSFDYKYFTSRCNDDFDVTSWNLNYRRQNEITTTKNQYHKLQWMDGWTDYDYVLWLDSDCYVYGNPAPFSMGLNPKPTLNFMHNEVVLKRWHSPNMSIWGGDQKLVQDAIDWARHQFDHPDDQHEIVQTLRCLNRYPIEYPLFYDDGLRQNISIDNFTEELFMIGYTHSRIGDTVRLFTEGAGFSAIGAASRTWTADSIIHFGGVTKLRELTRFRAYIAYLAYIGQEAPTDENHNDNLTYQKLREGNEDL